jgi:hypothetical protein
VNASLRAFASQREYRVALDIVLVAQVKRSRWYAYLAESDVYERYAQLQRGHDIAGFVMREDFIGRQR